MQELVATLNEHLKGLRNAIDKRYNVSKNHAEAEHEYRATLGRSMAFAKSDGMAATALYDYCRGLESVAALREKRDILEAQEEYLTELILWYRTSIRVLEGQLNAERKGL